MPGCRPLATRCLALAAALALATASGAMTLNPGNPLSPGDSLALNLPVEDGGGNNLGSLLGTITLVDVSDDKRTITWSLSLDAGSEAVTSLGLGLLDPDGAGPLEAPCDFVTNFNCPGFPGGASGTNPGSGVDVTAGFFNDAQGSFAFDVGGDDALLAGETSDEFFLTYPSPLDLAPPFGTVALASFMVDPATLTGEDFEFKVEFVPEPATALLLGAGLTALGFRRLRSS